MTDAALLIRLARARADFAAELSFAPSSTRPVVNWDWDESARTMLPDDTDVSAIGATLSSKMQRVLSRSYGSDMAVQRALQRIEPWCAKRHVKPREPLHDERGFICSRITRYVVTHGWGEQGLEESWMPGLRDAYYRRLIRKAAYDEDLSYEEASDFIAAALRQMESWMAEWQASTAA